MFSMFLFLRLIYSHTIYCKRTAKSHAWFSLLLLSTQNDTRNLSMYYGVQIYLRNVTNQQLVKFPRYGNFPPVAIPFRPKTYKNSNRQPIRLTCVFCFVFRDCEFVTYWHYIYLHEDMKSQTEGVPIARLQNSPSENEQSSKSSIRLATYKKQVHPKRKSSMVQMI